MITEVTEAARKQMTILNLVKNSGEANSLRGASPQNGKRK